VMKMNQRSRGGVYEQGERTSFGSPSGRPPGLPKSGAATQVYTIITNAAGEVVTAFPGLPLL
jgi:hypothetical protein